MLTSIDWTVHETLHHARDPLAVAVLGSGGGGAAEHCVYVGRRPGVERDVRRHGPGRAVVQISSDSHAEPRTSGGRRDGLRAILFPGAGLLADAHQPADGEKPGDAPLDQSRAAGERAKARRAKPDQEYPGKRKDDRRRAPRGRLCDRPLRQMAHRRRRSRTARVRPERRRHRQRTRVQFKDPNPVDIFGMADRAERFMAENAKAGKPFYVQLSWNALHASENALAASLAKYEKLMPGENAKRVTTAAITEDLDTGVGKVLAAIGRLGLRDNTYVIYMSDNGGNTGRRGPLHGGKGGLWEGGIRVPLIVRGPGVERGACCRVPVVGYDLFRGGHARVRAHDWPGGTTPAPSADAGPPVVASERAPPSVTLSVHCFFRFLRVIWLFRVRRPHYCAAQNGTPTRVRARERGTDGIGLYAPHGPCAGSIDAWICAPRRIAAMSRAIERCSFGDLPGKRARATVDLGHVPRDKMKQPRARARRQRRPCDRTPRAGDRFAAGRWHRATSPT